jgi:hypothetical protein
MDRSPKVTPPATPPEGASAAPAAVETPTSSSAARRGLNVQFGPTPSKPGSRLKGGR